MPAQTIRTHGAPGATASVRGVVSAILQQEGLRGLYRGYRATLLRNIPSAVLRFALYEELKIAIQEHETLGKWLKVSAHSSEWRGEEKGSCMDSWVVIIESSRIIRCALSLSLFCGYLYRAIALTWWRVRSLGRCRVPPRPPLMSSRHG